MNGDTNELPSVLDEMLQRAHELVEVPEVAYVNPLEPAPEPEPFPVGTKVRGQSSLLGTPMKGTVTGYGRNSLYRVVTSVRGTRYVVRHDTLTKLED